MTVDNLSALKARDDLLAVADAWPALRARLRPSGGASEVRTPPESKPPITVAVSDLIRQIEDRTRFYANVLIRETSDWKPTTSLMPGLLRDVAARYGHWTSGDNERMALDFCDDAKEMRRLVRGILSSGEPPRWCGPCPEGECDGELYQAPWSIDAKCRECGRTVDAAEWRALMEAAFASRLMKASELISALVVTGHDVPEKTVRTWIQRGQLPKVASDPDLFRFSDAWNLAERRKERRSA